MEMYRKSTKSFLGFSYWKEGRVNFLLVKVVNVFFLILSVFGVVISFTGPIIY
jgi:hypothetical protein